MPVSLPSDKHIEIQHLAHALLQGQPITVHKVMSVLGKTTFHANGHAQLCQLCSVIQSDMLNVNHPPVHFFLLTFLFQICINSGGCLNCSRVWSPCDFLFLMWLSLLKQIQILGFIFQGSVLPLPCSRTCSGFMCEVYMPCKNSRTPSSVSVRCFTNLRLSPVGAHSLHL